MVINHKPTGRAASMPAGLLAGGICALAGTLVLSAILAKLVDMEVIPQDKIGYGIMVLLLLCAFLGANVACGRIKRQYLIVSAISAGIYFVVLICITALFFGGEYSGVGVTAMLVLCGSLLAAFARSGKGEGRKRRKTRVRNG